MNSTAQEIERLTEKIIGCAIEVHRVLGPGLLESVYRECLLIELRQEALHVESERQVALDYKGHRVAGRLRIDLLVNECIIVELKAVDQKTKRSSCWNVS
jgi:GxxExxY protein